MRDLPPAVFQSVIVRRPVAFRSIHCETLRQLNVESGENWIMLLFHAISDYWAKRDLPLPGWERYIKATVGSIPSIEQTLRQTW